MASEENNVDWTRRQHEGPIKVTISDPTTGEVLVERIVENDYMLITVGNRYVKSLQTMGRPGRATHMIAVAVQPK
jgi:hypothetical protein